MLRANRKKLSGMLLLITLAIANVFPVMAASPEFARSQEEWARLKDNVLTYEELEDLIHEYNSTVQSNSYSYQKFLKDYGRTNEKVSSAYQDAADQVENSMSGESDAGSVVADMQAQLQADELRKQADETLEDSHIKFLTNEQVEKTLVAEAQSNMISYFTRQLEQEQKERALQSAEKDLILCQIQREAGAATDFDVMTAQENVRTAKENLSKSETSIREVREKLLVSLGWKHDDTTEIKTPPEPDMEKIEALNPEVDLNKALENHYQRRISLRKKENARDQETKEDLERTIKNQETQIALALSAAYRNVLSARSSCEQAKKAYEQSVENVRIGALKRQAGMMTEGDFQKLETTCRDSESQQKIENLALLQAVEKYQWTVNGLAVVN